MKNKNQKTKPANKEKLIEIMTELRDFIDNSPLTERNERALIEAQTLLRRVKNEFETISCFKCRALIERKDAHIWYAFDQDNMICKHCAKETEHTETAYAGTVVLKEDN